MKNINPKLTQYEPGTSPADIVPLCIPAIQGNEWDYIKECLDNNWVSSVGSFVNRFEQMVADYLDVQYAVATVNGTSALHIALLVAGVQPDDEVLVSTLSFIAPANAIRYVGAWPVFIDAEASYWQMNVENVRDFLENDCYSKGENLYNRLTNRRVKAIVPVHILGHPVDIDAILALASQYNLVVIEDAAESLGAQYKGRKVGSLGEIACLSFNGNKIITTGGGGMVLTQNEAWAKKAKYLTTQAKDDSQEYIHDEIGFNYRLTNIQAAMGCAQMEKLTEYIQTKCLIADTYTKAFQYIPGIIPMKNAEWAFSTCWLYTILIDQEQYGLSSRELLKCLSEKKIQTRPLWQPLHCSPAHQYLHKNKVDDVADTLYRQALSLPCSVGLTSNLQNYVIDSIIELGNSHSI